MTTRIPWSPWLSQVDLLKRSEEFIEECYGRSQQLLRDGLTCQPGWSTRRTSTSSTGKGWRKELFRSLLVFSFKNKVILKPCQGSANRSVETRPFPLLTVCSPIEPTYLRSRFFSWVGRRRSQHHCGQCSPVRPYSWHSDAGFWLRPRTRTRARNTTAAALFALRFANCLANPPPGTSLLSNRHKKGHASLNVAITMM